MSQTNDFIQAFCWALLHSLWLGLIIAAVAYIFILLSSKCRSVIRYNFFLLLGIIFVTGISVIFFHELWISTTTSPFIAAYTTITPLNYDTLVVSDSNLQIFIKQFNRVSPYLFFGWLLFFLKKSLQLYSQFNFIKKIRKASLSLNYSNFHDKLNVIAASMGIRNSIKLAESALIKMPILVGYFKPVILFPIGFVNYLTPQQVEIILIHELAHIRRRDYLINIFQEVIETVFFFNPGLLWLSSLIRAERENCCDDIVLKHTSEKPLYISTLINSYEFGINAPLLGLYFSKGNHSVLARVKRMIDGKNKLPGISTFLFLLMGLIIVSTFIVNISIQDSPKSVVAKANGYIKIHYHSSDKMCIDPSCAAIKPQNITDSIRRVKSLAQIDTFHKDSLINSIIRTMLKENVITNYDTISFALNKQKLIVNGVEQASCITQIFQDDFLKKKGLNEIEYGYQK